MDLVGYCYQHDSDYRNLLGAHWATKLGIVRLKRGCQTTGSSAQVVPQELFGSITMSEAGHCCRMPPLGLHPKLSLCLCHPSSFQVPMRPSDWWSGSHTRTVAARGQGWGRQEQGFVTFSFSRRHGLCLPARSMQ